MARPRFSFVTVSNDVNYLALLWKSLSFSNPNQNWEWIIGIEASNNSHDWLGLKNDISQKANVNFCTIPKVHRASTGKKLNYCINRANGEYFIFLEEGNVFEPDEFNELLSANYTHDLTCFSNETKLSARMLYDATCAPIDLFIWKKEIFQELKGFNTTLFLACGYELTCRTYLANKSIEVRSDTIIRNLGSKEKLEQFIQAVREIANFLLHTLISTEMELTKKPFLTVVLTPPKDNKQIQVQINEDTSTIEFYDHKNNLVEDNTVGALRIIDVLNFLNPKNVLPFFQKLWELLLPEGWIISASLSANEAGGFSDPRFASCWTPQSFRIFCLDDLTFDRFTGLFEATRIYESYPSEWHKKNKFLYTHADLMKLIRKTDTIT